MVNQFIGAYLLAKYSFPLQKCLYPKSRILHSNSDELHIPNNENILKITELMAEFDVVFQKHLGCFTNQVIYFGKQVRMRSYS